MMSHCSTQKTEYLVGLASRERCSQKQLAAAWAQFVDESGIDQKKVTAVACSLASELQPGLEQLAELLSVDIELCPQKWQQAMDKYIQKYHAGLEGLAWNAATVAMYRSGRKKLEMKPVVFNVDGQEIAVAACRIKNLPLASYRSHLVFCGIEPCVPESESKAFATRLRKLSRQLGLNAGARRLKITRSHCCGACRSGSVSVVYEALKPGEAAVNNGRWIAHGDELTDDQWLTIFQAIDERQPLDTVLQPRFFVEQQVR